MYFMYFIGGGGFGGPGCPSRGQYSRAVKTPLKTPPNPPPFLNLALGGFLSRISDFRETPPMSPPSLKGLAKGNRIPILS